jgi:hypothetical protein
MSEEEAAVDRRQARRIIVELAAGRDPRRATLGARSVVQRPEVIRALNYAVQVLDGSQRVVVKSAAPRAPRKPKKAKNSLTHWTRGEERAVLRDRNAGMKPSQIAKDFERSTDAVRARLKKLEAEAD